ncbi:MAG: restriction endonuclease subunit S, partial [Nitrososphaera sp.]
MKNQTLRQGYKRIQIQSGRQEEIPESWHIAPLKDVIQAIKTGFASGERDENGIVQLRMNNISDSGTLAFDKFLRVPIPEDVKQYDLRKDDVLFNNTNSLDLIGKSAIIGDHPDYTFSNHITRIRTDTKKLVPYFLLLLFLKYRRQAIF